MYFPQQGFKPDKQNKTYPMAGFWRKNLFFYENHVLGSKPVFKKIPSDKDNIILYGFFVAGLQRDLSDLKKSFQSLKA